MSDTSGTDPLAGLSDVEIRAKILEQYPAFAGFFEDNPEVGDIILRGFRGGESSQWVQAQVMATDWWRRTSEPARQWEAELQTDRAEALRRLAERMVDIENQLRQNGINPDRSRLHTIADQSLRFNWSPAQLNQAIAREIRISIGAGRLPAGESAFTADQLQAQARNYHVPMSRQTAETWALKILDGSATTERFQSYVNGLAKQRYAYDQNVVQALDAGLTAEDIFEPHKQEIANTLEMNPADINFLNPKWGVVTEFVDDKGVRRSMTLAEVGRWARGRDEFKRTDAANEQGATFATTLLQEFGEIAR